MILPQKHRSMLLLTCVFAFCVAVPLPQSNTGIPVGSTGLNSNEGAVNMFPWNVYPGNVPWNTGSAGNLPWIPVNPGNLPGNTGSTGNLPGNTGTAGNLPWNTGSAGNLPWIPVNPGNLPGNTGTAGNLPWNTGTAGNWNTGTAGISPWNTGTTGTNPWNPGGTGSIPWYVVTPWSTGSQGWNVGTGSQTANRNPWDPSVWYSGTGSLMPPFGNTGNGNQNTNPSVPGINQGSQPWGSFPYFTGFPVSNVNNQQQPQFTIDGRSIDEEITKKPKP